MANLDDISAGISPNSPASPPNMGTNTLPSQTSTATHNTLPLQSSTAINASSSPLSTTTNNAALPANAPPHNSEVTNDNELFTTKTIAKLEDAVKDLTEVQGFLEDDMVAVQEDLSNLNTRITASEAVSAASAQRIDIQDVVIAQLRNELDLLRIESTRGGRGRGQGRGRGRGFGGRGGWGARGGDVSGE